MHYISQTIAISITVNSCVSFLTYQTLTGKVTNILLTNIIVEMINAITVNKVSVLYTDVKNSQLENIQR